MFRHRHLIGRHRLPKAKASPVLRHDPCRSNGWGRNFSSLAPTASTTVTDALVATTPDGNADKLTETKKLKPSLSLSSLRRLIELSSQEWKLVGMSAATLGVTSSITLLLPFASGMVIDSTIQAATVGADASALSPMAMAGGLFGLTSIAGAGVYFRSLWLAEAGNRIVARLKQRLFASVLRQESAFLDKQTSGDLLSRLSSDAAMVEWAVTHHAVDGLRGLVMTLGSASMLLYTSPSLAAVSVCTLPPIFMAATHIGQQLEVQQEKVQELEGVASSLAEQSLSNMAVVKQFVAEDYEANRYHNAVAASHRKALDTAHMQAQLEAGTHVASNGAVLCVLGYGGSLVLAGSITAGDLTGFVMYSLLMAGNLSRLTSIYSDLIRSVAASNRVFEILDRQPQITSKTKAQDDRISMSNMLNDRPLDQIKYELKPTAGVLRSAVATGLHLRSDAAEAPAQAVSLSFESVNFRYPTRLDVDVLKDFNLTIEPGEVVALVGGSGSGKSTVASLLTRLYDIGDQDGRISINDKPLCSYDLTELRRLIGVVPQEPALFRGTIRENIAYGEWGRATEEQIMDAARLAHVLDFVEDFPDGLDTMVGPRGSQLSGGQRQRVSIARLLLRNPPLVILDEATSALDAKSEYYVQRAIDSVISSKHRTVISIAHRLSTIRHANRIAVLQDGAVVQSGAFDVLAANDGPFRELMKSQLVSAGQSRTYIISTLILDRSGFNRIQQAFNSSQFPRFHIDGSSHIDLTLSQCRNGRRRERGKQESNGRNDQAINGRCNHFSLIGSTVDGDPLVAAQKFRQRAIGLGTIVKG